MKAAAWAIEGLRALSRRGRSSSCVAALISAILKGFAPRGERVLANLRLVYPERNGAWRKDLRQRLYGHLAWMVTELLTLQRDHAQALEWVAEVRGWKHIDGPLTEGKGVLFLSGHYGNWELLAAWYAQYLKQRGLDVFYMISQETKDQDISHLIARYRHNAGIKLLPRKTTSTLQMVRLLKAGAHIALTPDISWGEGVVLPFMGHLCTNTTGPAVLGLAASVPIVPVALYREGPFRHVVEFFPPLPIPEGRRQEKIERLTRQVIGALERIIAPQPELWFWLHNRWKQGASHSPSGA